MKIVQIGGFLYGAQKTIEEGIHKHLCELGHQSYIFFEYGNANDIFEKCYETKIENIVTRGLRKVFGKDARFARIQTKRLIKKIKRINPDIIHLHVIHDGCVDYVYLFKYLIKYKWPVVYTMHDLWAITGGCYHYTQSQCVGYLNSCVNCQLSEKKLDCKRIGVAKAYYDKRRYLLQLKKYATVCVSQWVQEEVQKSFLAEKPFCVIHNGINRIDIEAIKKYKSPERKKKYRLISVANTWDETKGISNLFDLADKLNEYCEILLIGDIGEEYIKKCPTNILLYGYCNDKNHLLRLIQDADLNISLSLEETFGMTFVEAAIVGTKSIGFNCTAINEILSLTKGITVNEISVDAMANAILNTLLHGENKLSDDDIVRVTEYFDIRRMAQEYNLVYETVLKE